jgi:hypothetical protein
MSRAGQSRRTSRIALAALAALAAAAWAPSARADIIQFDPTGGGGVLNLPVATFDESPGNALSIGAVTAIGNTPNGSTTAPFATLYQARMSTLLGVNPITGGSVTLYSPGSTIPLPGGGSFTQNEISLVIKFFERAMVTGANSISLTSAGVSQAGSFLELYSDPTPDANDLTGTGFRDGTLILKALAVPGTASGSFANTPGAFEQFDQFPSTADNNYPGVSTVVGSGGTDLAFTVTSFDPNYFLTDVTGYTFNFNTSNKVPFQEVNPSATFYGTPDQGPALSSTSRGVSALPGTSPDNPHSIGTINGATGADIQFQSDANSSLSGPAATVPEPGTISLALTGIGLISLGALRQRRWVGAPAA